MINNDFSFFDLSSGPILNILSNLSVRELFVFSQVSKECKMYADEALLRNFLITCNQNESALEKVIEKWKTFFISAIDDSDNFGKMCMFKVYFSKSESFVFKLHKDNSENFHKKFVQESELQGYKTQKYILDDHNMPISGSLAEHLLRKRSTELVHPPRDCSHWMIRKKDSNEEIHCMAYLQGSECTVLISGRIDDIDIMPGRTEETRNQRERWMNLIEQCLKDNFEEKVILKKKWDHQISVLRRKFF